MEIENNNKESFNENLAFKQLIQKTEEDYRREEFQRSNSRYLQYINQKKQSLKQKHHNPIPDIEWWDLVLFDKNRRYYLPLDNNKITNLIEHPKPFKNEGLPNQNQNVVIPIYLTREERKKLRRRHRMEKEKEKQDKIKLGLIEPPPPKIKLSNMMRVLTNETVADPTKMEQLVRQGVSERLQAHLKRNQQRQLTKEQKADKFLRKLKRDSGIECRVALFRIESLTDRVHKFKVDINAQQLQLHGLLVTPVATQDGRNQNNMPTIIIVEGGPKAIKFYKKLLLRRIKWNKSSYLDKDENGNPLPLPELQNNKCALVWEGVVKDHSFNKWKAMETDSEVEAKRAFVEKNVEFYFDMAINYQYPE
ncbi:u4 u6 small nuclear, putative [Ichthyophthirius multifiliis]|uniref:U4 u6 small nuclear, putative n=1 Tax=Ichthyophthirius multifiliis TaxID=5932 RepID=G0R3Z4_ICHMU|nr:u4 u6 small nuclear, putative [Ichthyophthirius multifiliis]EGR27825.1 u4 u6 small nuclear, putative [Ichthyophthirius multifiliis]|eukprot:XP_004027170.1 u4 u6 small nuclear, putative [Ichthyophthirius multifiliis]